MKELDYRGHQCPYPVVETRKQILAWPDTPLKVLVDDGICRDNVVRLAGKMGYQATATTLDKGLELIITPATAISAAPSLSPEAAPYQQPSNTQPDAGTVIYCGSETMGTGDEHLGRILLKNFLATQLETDPLPVAILFINSGIHLTTEGSDALDALSALKQSGVDIASCGLCLDFYHKKEKLKVGRATNMLDIVEIQHRAARVITP